MIKTKKKQEKSWHNFTKDELFDKLHSSSEGITDYEAKIRLGKAESFHEQKPISFLKQIRTTLTVLLFILSIYFMLIGYYIESGIILVFVIAYAFLHIFKSRRIESQTYLIKNANTLKIDAIRNGEKKQVLFDQLVPGDIVFIKKGDVVPVHCRILDHSNISVDESIITDNKAPICKISKELEDEKLPEINNMLFPGSVILSGSCTAITVHYCKEAEKDYSLFFPYRINTTLGISSIVIALASTAVAYFAGLHTRILAISALSFALTLLPESFYYRKESGSLRGKLLQNGVIVRTPGAEESLKSVSVLCINKKSLIESMSVKKLYINDMLVEVHGSKFIYKDREINPKRFEDIQLLLASGQLCNNFGINGNKNPVDEAMLSVSISAGLEDLRKTHTRLRESDFDPDKRMMSVVYSVKNRQILYAKGAVDEILRRCSFIYDAGAIRRIRASDVRKAIDMANSIEKQGLEVIAFATNKKGEEKDLIFIGIQSVKLTLKSGLTELVNQCKDAGVKIFMITSAKKDLAENLAIFIGIPGKSITGYEIDRTTNVQLDELLNNIYVYSALSQRQRQKILERLREIGNNVAVVGSDLSDINCLKMSDIKISLETSDNTVKANSDITSKDPFVPIILAKKEE